MKTQVVEGTQQSIDSLKTQVVESTPQSIDSMKTRQFVESPSHPIDIFINQIFESKPQEKRNSWIQILKDNKLESLDELYEND